MQQAESSQFKYPDLSTDDPNWETFDEIEAYVSDGRTGLLARVLPHWAWDYWFAPSTVTENPETLEADRTKVVTRYRAVVNVIDDALVRLEANRSEDLLDRTDRITERLSEFNQDRFPASAWSLEGHGSFVAYLDEVATALARERGAVDTSSRLLAGPAVAFLREAERDLLMSAQTLFEYSIEHGRARRHAIARERREIIKALDRQLPQLATDLDQARAQAEPYLDLETFLHTNDTLDVLESIDTRLSKLRETYRIELLSHPLADQMESIETRVVSLQNELAESRKKYAEHQLEQLQETVEMEIDDLRARLEPAGEDGELIQSPDRVVTQTDNLRNTIQDYRAVVNVTEDALGRLETNGPEDFIDQTDQITRRLDDIDQHRFPASAKSLDDHDSFAACLDDVATALAREGAAVKASTRLLNGSAADFLWESECDRVKTAQTLLEYSVKHGRARRHAIARERRETVTTLERQLPELAADLDQARGQAEPYLDLEIYFDTNDTLDYLESINTKLSTLRETHRIELLSHSLADEMERIEASANLLKDDLEASRKKYAELQFQRLQDTVEMGIDELRARLEPAREDGELIQSPEEIGTRIDGLRNSIQDFREAPWRPELPPTDISVLSEYESQLDTIERFVEEKVRFDTRYKKYTDQFRGIRADAAPYLAYERYLIRPIRRDLVDRLESLTETVEDWGAKTRFDRLSQADHTRYTDLKETTTAIEAHLEDYNPRFVYRQREACEEFFSDIGPRNLDLTVEQQRAVIRNGIYNQVIAAAGTGKTLTLTTRVAYLVNVQNISPDKILVVTYTNNATQEMQERLTNQFGITGVEVRTLNSFGNKLLQAASDDHVETIDPEEKQHVIEDVIRLAREGEDNEFLEHYYQFLTHFNNQYLDEVDFENKKEYIEARRDTDYVTLEGTRVKSRAEKVIADFLYTYRVDYQYESRATWADTGVDKAGYTPDFYLPEYDVYIEHWGIDEAASVAPWFSQSSQEYRDKMRWARQQFEAVEYELVETYQFEHDASRLKRALRHRINQHGVNLDRMDFDELVETAFEYDREEKWIKDQFQRFIENSKRFDVTTEDIKSNIASGNPRQYHFGKCGIRICQQYADYLSRNKLIDFTDQIKDACSLVEDKPVRYRGQYDHLLVDEFQDIGAGKLELIRALSGPDGPKLFAVGDDWQSIYSFQGAAVDYFTSFEDYFGDPVRTDLTANFRSPPSIAETGNHLIEYNSKQLEKTVRATIDIKTTPQVHTLRGYRGKFHDYVRRVRRYTVRLVKEYLAAGADPSDIMILCRYDGAVRYLDEIKRGLRSQKIPYTGSDKNDQYRGPDGMREGISVYSIHQAKGREADHVILVHVADGSLGFPNNNKKNELLDPVQPLELGGLEEERRIFYVAVTRAERSLDLLTRADRESQFLEEIDDYVTHVDTGQVQPLEEVGKRMSVEIKVEELSDPWTKQHQRGKLLDKYGGTARFISWASDLPPTVEHGEWYWIENALVDEYKGEKELVITDTTTVERLPEGSTDPETAAIDGLDHSA